MSYGPRSRTWAWRRMIRDGIENSQLNGLLSLLASFDPTNARDCWEFILSNSKLFSVSAMRKYIECKILVTTEEEIPWNRMLPIKVNINTWRLCLDRLPTRCNLDARGVDLDSTRCPICDDELEPSQHLFVECFVASTLWKMVTTWWGLNDYPKLLLNMLSWVETVNMPTHSNVRHYEATTHVNLGLSSFQMREYDEYKIEYEIKDVIEELDKVYSKQIEHEKHEKNKKT
ncbi:RNA-directed DNA polymerase, eukaryota, Reverse transcriptase zinc-binding domain protein [Artemisia annua]|uniref:RNA-directed DNA polymerase, eukaryota, Reverse transcriptase zinc-binding domain protein n=1 Tax=Artemisia annua TaxID=35608 RepID=A0A2U1P1E2_ARTAN|nr:RNA-directed DNA polymerase, eukaryota, Reverse transcriptase zinc-binding domain protein [Artemisia annua]